MRPLLVVLLLLLANLAYVEGNHQCGHVRPQRVGYSATTSTRTRRQATERQPIRIVPWYMESDFNRLTPDQRDKYKSVVSKAIEFLSSFLKVDRLEQNILLQRLCDTSVLQIPASLSALNPYDHCTPAAPCQTPYCAFSEFVIPDKHLRACKTCETLGSTNCSTEGEDGPGVADADVVIYVAARENSKCSEGVLAYASHCFIDKSTDRPIAGVVNLCQNLESEDDMDNIVHTIVHELTHALAFHPLLFPFYRDENGNPRTPRDATGLPSLGGSPIFLFQPSADTILQETVQREAYNGVYDINIIKVVTPAVLREARNHFGCPTLNGLELENLGGDGTQYYHWKKRLVENEGMTGVISTNGVFSRLTFALYEDSGWYDVDYSVASPLRFGQCLGCDFAEKSCFSYGLDREPFCNRPRHALGGNTRCTYDRLAVAYCDLEDDLNVPIEYQYFSDPNLGGTDPTSDYCPVYTGSASCQHPRPRDLSANEWLQSVGPNSKCVDIEIRTPEDYDSSTILPNHFGACYEISCASESSVAISVGGATVLCQSTGQEVTISTEGFDIVIICPAFEDICWENSTTCSATSPPPLPPSSGLSQGGVIAIGVIFGLLSLAAVVIATLIVVAVTYKWLRGGGKAYSRHSGRPDNIRDSYGLIGEGLLEEEA